MAPIQIFCNPVLQKILPFIYLFFLCFTHFGHCSAQLSETHLYGAYDSGALALGPQVAPTFGAEVTDSKGFAPTG